MSKKKKKKKNRHTPEKVKEQEFIEGAPLQKQT